MDMRLYHKALNLTSPLGENISTSSFQMFLPNNGVDYTPVLLHCEMKGLGEEAYGVLKGIYESENPPIILLTYEPNAESLAEICKYIEDNHINDYFDTILSINNESVGTDGVYGTMYNNLPVVIEEHLEKVLQWGKRTNCGSKISESIGCLFNKPVISIDILGSGKDAAQVYHIMEYMPEVTDYDYHQSIRNTDITAKSDVCTCCGRRRPPMKFFYKIQGKLCLACESRIKKLGEVNLINFGIAALELKRERAQTRAANLRRNVDRATILCPHCGAELVAWGDKLSCTKCNDLFFLKRHRLYYKYILKGIPMCRVYELNGEYLHSVPFDKLFGGNYNA